MRLDPGAAGGVRVVILRALPPGVCWAETRYRSHDDGDRRGRPGLVQGVLTLALGDLTVTAPRPAVRW